MTRSFEHKQMCFVGLSKRVYSHCIQIRTWEKVIEVQMKYQITLPFVEKLAARGRATRFLWRNICRRQLSSRSPISSLFRGYYLTFTLVEECLEHFYVTFLNFYGHLWSLLFRKNKKVLLKPVARLYKKAVHFEIQN